MREETLFTLDAPYRPGVAVKGWFFGSEGEKTLAVMGALRGNELQQMYIASQLIQALKTLEEKDALSSDCGILVIPCANQFSMNVGRRFWAADNTDINRMFPGYDKGETTQRVAGHIFSALQGYAYGIHLTSFYLPGDHLSHVRLMETGYEKAEAAVDFGLPYVVVRTPQPYDTTTLNYNWQIWETQTFSLYTHATDRLDLKAAEQAVDSILRFLQAKGCLSRDIVISAGEKPRIFRESVLKNVLTTKGGILLRDRQPGDQAVEGDQLGRVVDPCTGELLEILRANCTGQIFFACKAQLVTGHEVAFRLLPAEL